MSLLWAAIARDEIVLAECGEETRGGSVKTLAKKIIRKKPSPGWEHDWSSGLRALKFHVHARGSNGQELVWASCCVYDKDFSELQAKGFLEKLALMTEPLRATPQWLTGGTLAAQDSFAPTLLQRMQQANMQGKTAMVSSKVDEVKHLMAENIELLLERGDKLEVLEDKADTLSKMSRAFQQQAKNAKRFQMWQQAKFGLAVGTAVTVGVGIVVAPPILAVAL
eukprot:CAMPEP_0119317812 /NCGR_PEP_ID=MMETSP1333-20130426/44443_1 /TAXON_ID=418940 /ORGANISM="Scyphosphaera apsteinii, Strain RCC1455" /LENGTH=222 /DNA_ID=CAMNT_0007323865 /DNA_START=24 /DNA_END=692 /DNA_ORIENTATION=+